MSVLRVWEWFDLNGRFIWCGLRVYNVDTSKQFLYTLAKLLWVPNLAYLVICVSDGWMTRHYVRDRLDGSLRLIANG
jgi:hypothetical protein